MIAIVSGASGFIGSVLVRQLISSGVEVIALGTKDYVDLPDFRKRNLVGATYLQINLDVAREVFERLSEVLRGRVPRYFFHLAWGGTGKLSDLDVEAQNLNIARTVTAYRVASAVGVHRFLFCGTMEEAFAEEYTKLDHSLETKFNRHVVYALAKISARHALSVVSDFSGPDVVFGTNSHVMGPGDDKDSFLQVALGKILRNEEITMSSGEQLFDVINVVDCAGAYIAIADKGVTGRSYWVGSGKPRKLREYVQEMNDIFPRVPVHFGRLPYNDVMLESSVFSTEGLVRDTGFHPTISFRDSVLELAATLV